MDQAVARRVLSLRRKSSEVRRTESMMATLTVLVAAATLVASVCWGFEVATCELVAILGTVLGVLVFCTLLLNAYRWSLHDKSLAIEHRENAA